MDETAGSTGTTIMVRIVLLFLAGIIGIPALAGILFGVPLHMVFGLVGSVLIFQPVAAGIGIALGIPPVPVFLILLSTGTAVTFLLYDICDLFAGRSAWLRGRLDMVNGIAGQSPLFRRYGILTLVPFIWVPGVGLYGCALLAWLFRWRGMYGTGIILCGWTLAVLIVMAGTIGVMSVIS